MEIDSWHRTCIRRRCWLSEQINPSLAENPTFSSPWTNSKKVCSRHIYSKWSNTSDTIVRARLAHRTVARVPVFEIRNSSIWTGSHVRWAETSLRQPLSFLDGATIQVEGSTFPHMTGSVVPIGYGHLAFQECEIGQRTDIQAFHPVDERVRYVFIHERFVILSCPYDSSE